MPLSRCGLRLHVKSPAAHDLSHALYDIHAFRALYDIHAFRAAAYGLGPAFTFGIARAHDVGE